MDNEDPQDSLEGETMEVVAIYVRDTKRFHLFKLEDGQGVTGALYFPKDGGNVPERITVILKTSEKE